MKHESFYYTDPLFGELQILDDKKSKILMRMHNKEWESLNYGSSSRKHSI